MNLQIGKHYQIILKISDATLTYNCKIIDVDENFISFIDKYKNEFSYNKNLILSYREVFPDGN